MAEVAARHRPQAPSPSSSHVARATWVVVLVAVAAGTAVAAGIPLVAAMLVAPVVLVAAIPNTERLGRVMIFAGFMAVAAFSDSVGSDPGVQQGEVQFSPVKWLAYGLLLAGILALLLPTGRPSVHLRLPHVLVLGYIVCSGVGAALGPDPGLFLLRWVQQTLPFLAAIVWWRRRGSSAVLVTAVLVAAGWHVLTASVSLALGRSYLSGTAASETLSAEGARLGGIVHPVLLAFSAALVAAWALWLILTVPPRRALLGFVALPLAGLTLGFSRGRTGFLAVLAMVVAVTAVATRRRRREVDQNVDPRMFLVVGVGLALIVFSATLVGWFVRGNAGEVRTLTNRTRLWEASWDLVVERPVLGWGPGLLRSGEIADDVRDQVGFVGHAHNAFLDACLAGGLVGGTLWLFGFMAEGRSLFRRRAPADDFPAFLPCLWVGLAAWGVVEGNLSGFGLSWFLFLALTVALPAGATLGDGGPRPPAPALTAGLG